MPQGMEYEPHFIGEETKAAEGHGEQARLDSKAERLLWVAAFVLHPLGLSPAATRRAPVRCCPALSTPRKGGDRQTNAQQRPVGGHSCPTGYAPEVPGKQMALRTEQVLSVSKRGHKQHVNNEPRQGSWHLPA